MTIQNVLAAMALGSLSIAGACSSTKPASESGSETPSEGSESPGADCGAHALQSPEHCTCLGGYVKGDIGDGNVACAEGETELERVQQGIEGAVCCKAN
jgi:hypothetical protein